MTGLASRVTRFLGTIGIRWQIMLLVVTAQIVAHITTFVIVSSSLRGEARQQELVLELADPLLTLLAVLPTDVTSGSAVLVDLVARDARFALAPAVDVPESAALEISRAVLAAVPPAWVGHVSVGGSGPEVWPPPFEKPFAVQVALADAGALVFSPSPGVLARTVPAFVVSMGALFVVLPIMLLFLWAGNALVSPIARLADGVDAFAHNIDAPEVSVEGATEVRRASASFNAMRQRLRKLVNDRSLTLAAIGHDMRTPLTRLRLRVETQEPEEALQGIQTDLAALERMIDDALQFLRAEHQPVRLAVTDLAVLCRTVCNDFADRGGAVRYDGASRLSVTCDSSLMRRVLENTLGNAVAHAGGGTVALLEEPGAVRVEVSDRGPGIPSDLHDIVTEPFTRLDGTTAGRDANPGGFGLGLAIARQLMQRQGGQLTLHQNDPSGLIVRLALPQPKGRLG
jgi:signal transduction histidine kinase